MMNLAAVLDSRRKRNRKRQRGQSDSGQIIIEYILLLIIAVSIAVLITRTMVGADKNSPGFVITTWNEIILAIGKDKADDVRPQQ